LEQHQDIKFSIVIPTYNRAQLIAKTLRSVKNQSYSNFEAIIVDNCSTDNTHEVLLPFLEDKRFRYIRNDRNYERGYSRNVGMSVATGDYLTLLDSDDLVSDNFLQSAANYIVNNSYDIFHNLYVMMNGRDEIIYKYSFPPVEKAIPSIAEGNFLSCIGVFISKKIYSFYRFDVENDITGVEDWDFWLRILAVYPLGRIEEVNSFIIDHADRTVRDIGLANSVLAKKNTVIAKIVADRNLHETYGSYLDRMYACTYLYAASLANDNHEVNVALASLLKAALKDWRMIFTKRFLVIVAKAFSLSHIIWQKEKVY